MKLACPSLIMVLAVSLGLAFVWQDALAGVTPEKLVTPDPLKRSVLHLKDFGKAGIGGDDSAVFRRALSEGSRLRRAVEIPATRTPYRLSPLYIPSNSTVLLDAGVVIQALPGFADGQKLLNINDATAVQVIGYGASLKMNRVEYRSGEYRHCLSITGSSLVAVRGITCMSPGGNGVYIGGSDTKQFSEDITLEDLKIENSVSAGLQVVSAKNLAVRRCRFVDSHGWANASTQRQDGNSAPGIQINPNGPGSRLENVTLDQNITGRNAGDGIRVVLSRMTDASTPVTITVLRHRDVEAGGSSYFGTNDPLSGRTVRGNLTFEDCDSERAQQYGAVFSFWNSSGARASFRGLTVVDPNGRSSNMDNAAIAVKRGGGGRSPIGNIEFLRTTIRDTRLQPKLSYYFSFADYSHIGIENLTFCDPLQLIGARHKKPLGLYQGEDVDQIRRPNDPVILALWQNAEKRDLANRQRARP